MNNVTKTILVIVVIAIVAIGVWYEIRTNYFGSKEKPVVKVGVIIPLTGSRAEAGGYEKKGLELALQEINQNTNKKYQVELIYEDSQYDPTVGVTAFRKLKDLNQVNYVIGAHGSSVTLAIAPIAQESKTILITPGSQATNITNAGDYIFRAQINLALEIPPLADFVFKKAQQSPVHLLILNTDYGVSFTDNFIPYYRDKLGGKIGLIEKYNTSDSDFRTQLTKIKNENPEFVVIAAVPKPAAMIMKQAKEMGIQAQFFTTAPVESQDFLETGKESVEGIIFTSGYDDTSENPVMKVYRDKYLAKYQEPSEMYSAASYDTLHILSNCFEEVGDSVENVKQCLYAMKDYQGASGLLSFDANGDIVKPLIFKTVKNGQFVPFSPEN